MFEENNSADQSGNNVENTESNSQISTFIIGDREYTIETAAKKIENADAHIRKIEEENAQMREQLAKAKSIEDVMNAMNQNKQSTQQQTPPVQAEDLTSLIEGILTTSMQKRTAQQNLERVEDEMKKAFGDKAEDVYKAKREALGFSAQTMQTLASENPRGFMQLFASEAPEQVAAPTQGSGNSENLGTGPKKGTYAFYQQLKKDNPSAYNSPQIQAQMLKDADDLGPENFFS